MPGKYQIDIPRKYQIAEKPLNLLVSRMKMGKKKNLIHQVGKFLQPYMVCVPFNDKGHAITVLGQTCKNIQIDPFGTSNDTKRNEIKDMQASVTPVLRVKRRWHIRHPPSFIRQTGFLLICLCKSLCDRLVVFRRW